MRFGILDYCWQLSLNYIYLGKSQAIKNWLNKTRKHKKQFKRLN